MSQERKQSTNDVTNEAIFIIDTFIHRLKFLQADIAKEKETFDTAMDKHIRDLAQAVAEAYTIVELMNGK